MEENLKTTENISQENITPVKETKEIDFSSKDFEATQKLLQNTAKLNTLGDNVDQLQKQKEAIVKSTIGEDENSSDIIQEHLDKWEDHKKLAEYLKGSLKDKQVIDRINSFFTNDETGEMLEMATSKTYKTESEELEFKRDLLIYLKENDDYMKLIDEEVEKLNRSTDELNSDIAAALDPLNDNILAYAEYLERESIVAEGDSKEEIKRKAGIAKKAKSIKSGYTFENLIELIEAHPNVVDNALRDFKSEQKIKEIGKRYAAKLKTAKIDFNLFSLLSDDIHKSLEYRCLPKGDYPNGLENFTVFFIVRAMAMGLNKKEDIVFHASVQISLSRLMDGTLDDEVAIRLKESIIRLLNKFA